MLEGIAIYFKTLREQVSGVKRPIGKDELLTLIQTAMSDAADRVVRGRTV